MSDAIEDHLERVRSNLLEGFSLKNIGDWIEKRTTLEGQPFSFVGHEFQRRLADEESRELVVKKCSQVGITEFAIRRTLAVMDILPDIHVIYTLPTSNFAKMVTKTRINPIVDNSDYLRSRLNTQIDSTDTKQLGSSYLYIKGTIGQAAAISVPASLLVHDEVDFSDQTVLSSYQSRMTHSRYKMKFQLSTPTVPKFGIDEAFNASRKHFNFCKCSHCAQWFLPDYFDHVRIPGFTGDLREITKENIHSVRYQEAFVVCPHCGRTPELGPAHRNWVLENPDEAHVAAGYQISPFDAPSVITPAFLIESSTKYKRYADFINFNLGQCAEDKDNALTSEELDELFVAGEVPKFSSYIVGIDCGMIMHVVIAGITTEGLIHIVKMSQIPLSRWQDEFTKLIQQYRFSNGVIDSQPYTDLVLRLQESHQKMFAAVYVTTKTPEVFTVAEKEDDPEKSTIGLLLAKINRNKALDALMGDLRRGKITVSAAGCQDQRETWVKHMTDMRRVQKFDKDDELFFNWEKSSKGNDHFHHATLYLYIASLMRGFGDSETLYGSLMRKFKNRGSA